MYDCVEIAELLGVARGTVCVRCRTGKLKCKVDRTENNRPIYMVSDKDLAEFGRKHRKYGKVLAYTEVISNNKRALNELIRVLKREGLGK